MASTARRTLVPLALAIVAFAVFMPVLCAGSSGDPTLGCDTWFGWTLPWSDGSEALSYLVPTIVAVTVFAVARTLLARRGRGSDPVTSRS